MKDFSSFMLNFLELGDFAKKRPQVADSRAKTGCVMKKVLGVEA
jgi:hypothetical protein